MWGGENINEIISLILRHLKNMEIELRRGGVNCVPSVPSNTGEFTRDLRTAAVTLGASVSLRTCDWLHSWPMSVISLCSPVIALELNEASE